ncbi:unnamed protein product, partial [Darwinula stevensoni]
MLGIGRLVHAVLSSLLEGPELLLTETNESARGNIHCNKFLSENLPLGMRREQLTGLAEVKEVRKPQLLTYYRLHCHQWELDGRLPPRGRSAAKLFDTCTCLQPLSCLTPNRFEVLASGMDEPHFTVIPRSGEILCGVLLVPMDEQRGRVPELLRQIVIADLLSPLHALTSARH